MGKTARVFMTGDSQAVRLPEEFRFKGGQVRIRKEGDAVILEPVPDNWDWLAKFRRPADEDFLRAALDARKDQHQPRPEIDELSK